MNFNWRRFVARMVERFAMYLLDLADRIEGVDPTDKAGA